MSKNIDENLENLAVERFLSGFAGLSKEEVANKLANLVSNSLTKRKSKTCEKSKTKPNIT